jgi:PAS domain S-box-containing protein
VSEDEVVGERLAFQDLLLEHTEDAIVAVDREWHITFWNKGAERMYGWTMAEVLGRHVPSFVRVDLNEKERAEVRREVAERGRWRGQATVQRKDGSTVSVEVSNVAIRDSRGEITGFLGIHRDVSERRRAERALREAQRRSETILESISDDFLAVDPEWRLTYVNERGLAQARRATGRDITAAELLGMSLWEVAPQLVAGTIYRELHRAMREQRVVACEAYSEATGRWLEVRAYPTEHGLTAYTQDISARKAAQEELSRRAEQQALVAALGQRALASEDLQVLFDEAVGLVARTLHVEFAGVAEMAPGGEEIVFRAGFGWREGFVGRRIGREGRDSLMGYTLRCREPVIVEDMATDRRFRASAGARDHGVVSALSVMVESRDEPFGTLAALSTRRRTFSPSDVSFVQAVANVLGSAVERSRAQARLGEVREAERSRIARDLHDEALQELTDALVQADRVRSACVEPELAEGLVSALKRVGQQLRGAIYDLRLEEEESRAFPEALRALVAVEGAMAVDCEVSVVIREGSPTGSLGRQGIEVLRIVGEALTNARRHSGARHVRVTAGGSEGGLCVEVTDDGRGFHPAAQPSGTAGRGIQGMRERAALLDADLDIRSTPGTGTAVRIELRPPQHHERPRTTARILLVEDHTAVRDAIAAMFDHEPDLHVVAQAASLAEARRTLHDVDIAVVDLGLPDGSGGDLIKELRDVNPRAQALVLSASLDPEDLARAIDSGAAATLDKTTDLDDLVDAVRRLHRGDAAPS